MIIKAQWKKRVELTQYIYSCLIKDSNFSEIKSYAVKIDFDSDQMKVIEYYANHKTEIISFFSQHLKNNWVWSRISLIQQAILIVAYCEVICLKLPKAVIIDQALITADKYGQSDAKKFLNAILDKVLSSLN